MGQQTSKIPTFQGGQMYIETHENQVAYVAGQVIYGTIHVKQTQAFDADNLTVAIYGEEHTFMRQVATKKGKRGMANLNGTKQIINMVFPIAQYLDGPPQAGEYSFPFALQLPEWLPASIMLAGDADNSKLSIRYFLHAQFTPRDQKDWVAPQVSSFRTRRLIFLYRPMQQFQTRNLEFGLTNKIGGFMGMGKSESTTEIIFEKNEFYPGEKAKVRIICNNSNCSKKVKSFKFKIHREYKGYAEGRKQVTHGNSYLSAVKEKGCNAKTNHDMEYLVQLPTHDPERSSYNETHPDELAMLKSFSGSMKGDLFSIEYTMRVFIKHDSYNAFGEGNCISLPIRIIQPPQPTLTLDIIKELPQGWNPFVAQPVQLALPPMNPSDPNMPGNIYYKTVIAPTDSAWKQRETMKATIGKEPEPEQFPQQQQYSAAELKGMQDLPDDQIFDALEHQQPGQMMQVQHEEVKQAPAKKQVSYESSDSSSQSDNQTPVTENQNHATEFQVQNEQQEYDQIAQPPSGEQQYNDYQNPAASEEYDQNQQQWGAEQQAYGEQDNGYDQVQAPDQNQNHDGQYNQ